MSADEVTDKTVVATDTIEKRLKDLADAPPAIVMLEGPADHVGRQWQLTKSLMVVGRVPESQIFVDDKSVSKNHLKFTIAGGEVSVADLGSTNGTIVNGEKLQPEQGRVLRNNDQITMGNIIFKFLEKGNLESSTYGTSFDRSQIDSLTQIHNKGAYLTKIEEAFKRAQLTMTPLSLIVFDLDFFKKVNDNYGHAAGDYVLKELAEVIKTKVVRDTDFFARYGGEEFVVILAGSPLKPALDVAERLRATVEGHDFNFEGQKLPITVSVGVATLETEMKDVKDLFEKADQASYKSKKGGRNRVSTV